MFHIDQNETRIRITNYGELEITKLGNALSEQRIPCPYEAGRKRPLYFSA